MRKPAKYTRTGGKTSSSIATFAIVRGRLALNVRDVDGGDGGDGGGGGYGGGGDDGGDGDGGGDAKCDF